MPSWGKAEFDTFYSASVERWGVPPGRVGIRLGYHWAPIISAQSGVPWMGLRSPNYPQLLFDVLGLVAGDAVLIVGCGFNGTGAGLTALGVRVIGTELSTYVQNEKGNSEEAEIRAACITAGVDPDLDMIKGPQSSDWNPLDMLMEGGRAAPAQRGKGEILEEELRVRGSRNAVRNRFNALWPGVVPRYIITEEVLNSIPDNEAALVCDYIASAVSEWAPSPTVVHMLSPLQVDATQAAALNWKTYAGWRSWLTLNGFATQMILPTVTARGQGMFYPSQAVVEALQIAVGDSAEVAASKALRHVTDQRVLAYSGLF